MLLGFGLWFILSAALHPEPWGGTWWILLFGSFMVGASLTDSLRSKK